MILRPLQIILILSILLNVGLGCYLYLSKSEGDGGVGNVFVDALVLKQWRNNQNQQITETQVLTGSVKELKTLINSKDSVIAGMARELNKNSISIARIKTITEGLEKGGTDVSDGETDTVYKDSLIYIHIYPHYSYKIDNKWLKASILATRDSTTLKYSVINEYKFWQETKGKDIQVSLLNLNPNTTTKELVTFTVQQPKTKPKRLLWFLGGLMTGFTGTLLIDNYAKQYDVTPSR